MNATVAALRGGWRPERAAGLSLLLVAIAALYWPACMALHRLWLDTGITTYTHGYLIVALSVMLLWRSRVALTSAPLRPLPLALPLLLLLALAWQFAYYAGIQMGYVMLLPLLLWVGVCAVFGMAIARGCSFALGYLYFAMPVWDYLNPAAQWGTVYAVQQMLRVVGVTAYFDANRVELQSGTFEIQDGCSGLHFIMVGLALAALLGELRRDDMKTRLKLLGLMFALAIATNWVRVFVIIVAGDLTHMQHYLVRVSHYGFGWCVFAAALVIFFLVERRMQAPIPDEALRSAPRAGPDAAPVLRIAGIAITALLVAALPRAADAFIVAAAPETLAATLPRAAPAWTGPYTRANVEWSPVFIGADLEQHAMYRRGESQDSQEVEFYAAWYATQRQDKKLGGFRNTVVGTLTLLEPGMNESLSGHLFRTGTVANTRGQRSVLWYSYGVQDRSFTSPIRAQLQYSVDALTQLRAPVSRVIAARARCVPDCATASGNLRSFFESAGDVQ